MSLSPQIVNAVFLLNCVGDIIFTLIGVGYDADFMVKHFMVTVDFSHSSETVFLNLIRICSDKIIAESH